MILQKLEITNYRNIKTLVLYPSKNLTVISGDNGQGKTNLLESIWLLTGSKSFRTNKDLLLINKDEDFSSIKATFKTKNDNQKIIELKINKDITQKRAMRKVFVDGVDYNKASDIAGIFNCVVFSPEHLLLVKGNPDERRHFIDASLCQLYPNYLDIFKRYVRLIKQKNALLKDLKKGIYINDHNTILDALDLQLSCCNLDIINKRISFIKDITPLAKENYKKISGDKEKLHLEYECFCNEEITKENILEILKQNRYLDIKAGFSCKGIHRDDLQIFLNNENAKIFASQGQQRSIVLALKIAEAMNIENITFQKPCLLLDDVLSELDKQRQNFLLTKINETQVFVTSCDYNQFNSIDGIVFEMNNGEGKNI